MLPLPTEIEISESGTCNRSCSFCPRSSSNFIDKNTKLLEEIFEYASVVHFLGANRYEKHIGWEHFKNKKMKIY